MSEIEINPACGELAREKNEATVKGKNLASEFLMPAKGNRGSLQNTVTLTERWIWKPLV